LEHIPGLPDLVLFWMNDGSVIRVSRCGITRGTLYGKHVLTLIWVIMTDGSFKIVSNWAVLTLTSRYAMGSTWTRLAPAAAQRSSPWLLEWHEAPLCASDTQACSSGWALPSWLVAMPAKNQMINCWTGRYPQNTTICSQATFSVAVQGTREVHNMHVYMRCSSTTSEDFCELVW